MNYISCTRCGTRYNAGLDRCPACGAANTEWKKIEVEKDPDSTRVWKLTPEEIAAAKAEAEAEEVPPQYETMVGEPEEIEKESKWSKKDSSEFLTRPLPVEKIREEAPPASPRRRAVMEEEYDEPERRRKKKRKKKKKKNERTKIFLIGAAVLLAVLVVVLAVMGKSFRSEKPEKMPNLVGKTESAAVSVLTKLDCKADITYEFDEEVAKGKVISQDVEEDTELEKGQVVGLVVSKGSESDDEEQVVEDYVIVPDLENMTYEEAEQALSAKGLKILKYDEQHDDHVAKGSIITQNPLKDARVNKGSYVKVTVSLGKEIRNYSISVTVGKGGSSSQKGTIEVKENESLTLTFTPDDGYEISDVKVDGSSVGAVSQYTFSNVTDSHTIYVTFKAVKVVVDPTPDPEPTPTPTPNPTPEDPGDEPIDPDADANGGTGGTGSAAEATQE